MAFKEAMRWKQGGWTREDSEVLSLAETFPHNHPVDTLGWEHMGMNVAKEASTHLWSIVLLQVSVFWKNLT